MPPWWRDRVPLLCLEGELLAVGDLCLCDSSRWRDSAQRGESLWRLNWNRAIRIPMAIELAAAFW